MGFDEEELERRLGRARFKKLKDSRMFEVVEEVFDYRTLMALYDLVNRGVISLMHGAVAAGKEARIYWAEGPRGEDLAVKIYLVTAAEFRRGRLKYMEGDPRFRRVGRSMRSVVRAWCSKEYSNLVRAHEAGVRVPRPVAFRENVLVMEFVDSGVRGVPAPLIKDCPPDDPDAAYREVKEFIRRAYLRAGLVHADLSEYNIMNRLNILYIIDWGSGVLKSHPNANEFLLRDIETVFRYFERLGAEVDDPREFYNELLSLG